MSEQASQPRGKPSSDGRFIWLSSLAVEYIVNELGATQAAYGIAVYVALCRLSSKAKNSPQVQVEIAKLAGMARLSYRKTADTLNALAEDAKVISIESGPRSEGQVKQPANLYTLLACRHNKPTGSRHNKPSRDGIRDRTSRAENPKDSDKVRESKENNSPCSSETLAAADARQVSESGDQKMVGGW